MGVAATPDRGEITDALIAMLESVTGKQFGDGQSPGTQNVPPEFPYGIVHAVATGTVEGSLNRPTMPDAVIAVIYQIDAVGKTRSQADWLGQAIRRAITDKTISPNGWENPISSTNAEVINRTANSSSGTTLVEGLFQSHDRFDLMVTVKGPDAVM